MDTENNNSIAPDQAPPPQSSPTSAPITSTPMGEKKSGMSTMITFLIGFALVIAMFLGYIMFLSKPSPEEVMNTVFDNMKNLHSFGYAIQIDAEIHDGPNPFVAYGPDNPPPPVTGEVNRFLVSLSGMTDMTDVNRLRGYVNVSVTSPDLFAPGESITVENRFMDSLWYLRPTAIPSTAVDFEFFLGKWITISSLSEDLAILGGTAAEYVPSPEKRELTAQDRVEIERIVKESGSLRITNSLGNAEVGGIPVMRYGFTVDKPALRQMIIDISRVKGEEMDVEQEVTLDRSLGALDVTEGELWVGKNDLMLHGFTVNLVSMDENGNREMDKGGISITAQLKDFNQPVLVEVPAGTRTISEIFAMLLFGNMGFDMNDQDDAFDMIDISDMMLPEDSMLELE